MLKYIEETGKYVEITGFRNVRVGDAEKFVKAIRKDMPQGVCAQFFDSKLVATWQHLYFAVLNALLAFKNERNISKSLEMEVMLYASAQRQIRKAIQLTGVKRSSTNMAIVIIGEKPESVKALLSAVSKHISEMPNETVLEVSKDKLRCIREAFGITKRELETVLEKDDAKQALVKLVVERIALLSTQI